MQMCPRWLVGTMSAVLALCAVAACNADSRPGSTSSATGPSSTSPAISNAASTKPSPSSVSTTIVFVPAPEGDDVTAIVRDEAARSRDARVMVYVGATWCEPCRRFHAAAVAGELDKTLPKLRFVELDLDHDAERLKRAGYTSKLIPLFAVPGIDGGSSGRQIEGSIKGAGAVAEISPRLLKLLESSP